MKRVAAIVATAFVFAGCGGGGGVTAPAAPPQTQTVLTQTGSIGLTFATTAAASTARRPLFVSPNATSAVISVNGGIATPYDVSATSSLCTTTAGARTCAIPVTATAGQLSISVTLMQVLSTAATVTLGQGSNSVNVVIGTPFSVTIGISPQVAGVNPGMATFPSTSSFSFNKPGSGTGTITFADGSGANITGSGNVPSFLSGVTLTSSDPHVGIVPAILTTPGQPFTMSYDGSPLVAQSVTITAKTSSNAVVASSQFTFSGLIATRYNIGAVGTIQPNQITVGPDNNIWWVERSTNDVGTLNLTTRTITHYPTGFTGFPTGIAAGGDGTIYYSNSGTTVARMTTSGVLLGNISVGASGQAGRLATDAGGNVWYVLAGAATSQNVGYIDKTTHLCVNLGGPITPGSLSTSSDLALGSDNAIYVLELGGTTTRSLLRVTTLANGTAGTKTETAIPNTSSTVFPLGIASGPDGNLWISVFANNATSQFYATATPGAASTITEYPTSINPALFANLVNMARGPDGNMWIAEGGGAVRITPSTPGTSVTQFFTDNAGSTMNDCVAGPDGNMYCTVTGGAALPPFNATQDSILSWVPR